MKTAKERVKPILRRLKKLYPEAGCSLRHADPLELLVATILSAQCTDKRVNDVTRTLFFEYKKAEDYASADPETFEARIRSTGFYRNKTKAIIAMAKALVERHNGKVPSSMSDLVKLPGVGRKTANVVLGNAYGIDAGIVVDTHVKRLCNRMQLTRNQDPERIERDLMEIVPKREWTLWPHLLIHHGREVCSARKPKCEICALVELCPGNLNVPKLDRYRAEN